MKKLTLLLALTMILFSCKPEVEKPVGPIVITAEVTDITSSSAKCGGGVSDGGGAVVVERGVCWNTSGNPTVLDFSTKDGSGLGTYISNITDLEHNTTYYVRAYAANANGVAGYGPEVSFTTLEKLLPIVTTNTVTNIKATTATCGGNVTFDGNSTVTARGICWSTLQNPTIEDNKTSNGSGVGSYASKMGNLELNTTYYVRAYTTNEVGTAYGEEVSFTTLADAYSPATGTSNGYGYVDLGLSVKWATCNVGASKPEEYGNYYAWGETSTKETYDYGNCATYGLSISELQSQGYIDGAGNLNPQYDAATANWGGDWRMPTEAEMQELLNNCTWEWINTNGVNGYKVTGPSGASIFLPAAGYRDWSKLYGAGSYGPYWSSAPIDVNGNDAYGLYFNDSSHHMNHTNRYNGQSVRSVLE